MLFSRTLLIAFLLWFTGLATGAMAQGEATVSLSPAQLNIPVGGTAIVDIRIDNVSNLYGSHVVLRFDPSVVAVVDASPQAEGVQIAGGNLFSGAFLALNTADNVMGSVAYALTLLAPAPTIQGGGVLASVTFRGLKDGASYLSFEKADLVGLDKTKPVAEQVQSIPHSVQGGVITVGAGGTPSPPPPTATATPTPTPTLASPTPGVPTAATATPTASPTPSLTALPISPSSPTPSPSTPRGATPTATPALGPSPLPPITPTRGPAPLSASPTPGALGSSTVTPGTTALAGSGMGLPSVTPSPQTLAAAASPNETPTTPSQKIDYSFDFLFRSLTNPIFLGGSVAILGLVWLWARQGR